MSTTTHPLTDALASSDPAAIAACLADDVTFHTPILTQELHGKELALRSLSQAVEIITDLSYYDSIGDDELTIMFWRGHVWGRDIEGATVITAADDDLAHELTVLSRSWSVVQLFRDAMLVALA